MAEAKTITNSTSGSSHITTLLAQLPISKWWEENDLYQWEGFWFMSLHLEATLAARSHFEAHDDDVILASSMKTGNTWLRALIPCIIQKHQKVIDDDQHHPCPAADHNTTNGSTNVHDYEQKEVKEVMMKQEDTNVHDDHEQKEVKEVMMKQEDTNDLEKDDDILMKNAPHDLVPNLEIQIYTVNPKPDDYLSSINSPRLFNTHLPYSVLPESIKTSKCKIVFLVRNPKDTFLSLWHFMNKTRTPEQGPFPIEEAFGSFCEGTHPFGPFFDHTLEYWKESLKSPGKILFLKYEEMKRDPKEQVKKLASFLGKPFVKEEDVEKMLWECSFDRMRDLEVNKKGNCNGMDNSSFFRLGTVGEWKNNFTPEMTDRIDGLTRAKLEGFELDLEISS